MIDQDLRTFLLADATLQGLLGDTNAVYPVRLPQGAFKPCVTYAIHDGIANLQAGSVAVLRRYSVTLKVYSEDYASLRLITERIRSMLTGLSTTWSSVTVASAHVHNVFTEYGETHEHYCAVLDCTIHIRD